MMKCIAVDAETEDADGGQCNSQGEQMNNKAVKPLVLGAIFLVAMIVFGLTMNKSHRDMTTNMSEASLPVVNFVFNDTVMNELHGYTQEMDLLSMRDSVLPIGEDRKLQFEVVTYGNQLSNMSYQIRSLDGTRLLMEDNDVEYTMKGDKASYSVDLPSLFEEKEEYHLTLTLTVDDRPVYYYTRLMKSSDCYVEESLDFVLTFHEYTFRDDAGTFIPTYMDPATGDATNLAYVDLTCTLRQVTWANLEANRLTEPVVSFKEITPSYNVLTVSYVVVNVNEANEIEYYNVEEYYRLRRALTRMYVLNFERRVNQIFNGENDFLRANSQIVLGIRDKNVHFMHKKL